MGATAAESPRTEGRNLQSIAVRSGFSLIGICSTAILFYADCNRGVWIDCYLSSHLAFVCQFLQITPDSVFRDIYLLAQRRGQHFIMQIYLV